jgi:cytochrome c556
MKMLLRVLFALSMFACSPAPDKAPIATSQVTNDGNAWLLSGTTDERFARVAKHLRGFDVAMVETGYRYTELYWAGQDRNWDYAKYQIGKIRTAVGNGVERRPGRAASAQMLEGALRGVEEAVTAKDPALFSARFQALTATCNACHQVERVPFVHVQPPSARTSPVRPLPVAGGKP